MFRQRGARPSRGQQHETPLQAWQKDVQRSGLQDVLSSLPTPESFRFNKVRKNGHDTITLFLGNRPNPNGSTSQVWARIVSRSEKKDFQPPLLFYDQVSNGTCTIQYPRSASSLLRKATLLLSPFCFLQHDLMDESTNVREILSAVVLYLAAAADVDASAWRWDKFCGSLIQALRYIDSRDAFHAWRHQQKLAALAQTNTFEFAKGDQDESKEYTHAGPTGNARTEGSNTVSTTPNGRYSGGTVRSRGSDIAITPNTSLEKLKRELGDRRFKMLDQIPPKPMTISPHDLGGSLFSFRMFVGTAVYQETEEVINLYAYIDRDEGKSSMYFMSHDKTGLEQIYDVNDMREGVDLVQPFEYLNNLKKVSYKNDAKSARTAKLRSLVSYYFFLAENQGLIGNPKIDVHEAFGKRLCAVCKELSIVKWDNDDNGGIEEYQDEGHNNAEVDSRARNPARNVCGSAIIGTKRSPEEEIITEPLQGARLRTRSDAPSDVAVSESFEPNEEILVQHTSTNQSTRTDVEEREDYTLGPELRHLSESTHENPRISSVGPGSFQNVEDSPSDSEPVKAALSIRQTMESGNAQAEMALNVSGDETSTALPAPHMLTAGRIAETSKQACLVSAASLGNKDAAVCAEACHANHSDHKHLPRLFLMNDSTLGKAQQSTDARITSRSSGRMTDLLNATLHDKRRTAGIDLDQFISKTICYINSGKSKPGKVNTSETEIAEHEYIGAADTFDWALFGRAACFPSNTRPAMASFLIGPLSVQSRSRAIGANAKQAYCRQLSDVLVGGGSEHVSIDMSQPTAAPSPSPASSIGPNKAYTAPPGSDLQLTRDAPNLFAAQLGEKKPPTPEGSAERHTKFREESTETPRRAEQRLLVLDCILISGTEDVRLPRPVPRSMINRTTEARKCVRDNVVDLTQLSSSPRGKKRKSSGSVYLSDSENDVIAETDGSEWRQKSRSRRK